MTSPAGAPFDPLGLIAQLKDAGIEFVVVGSFAALIHGSPLPPVELEIAVMDSPRNRRRFEALMSGLPATTSDGVLWSTPMGPLRALPAEPGSPLHGARHSTPLKIAPDLTVNVASLRALMVSATESPRPQDRLLRPVLSDLLELTPMDTTTKT